MKRRRISRKIKFEGIETMARTVQMMKLRRKLIEIIKKKIKMKKLKSILLTGNMMIGYV